VATMPWLVLLARSRVYGPFRIAGAALTGIAAAGWLAERAFGWFNPIAPLVESVASHGLWLIAGLFVLSVIVTVTERGLPGWCRRSSPCPHEPSALIGPKHDDGPDFRVSLNASDEGQRTRTLPDGQIHQR
jgi:hypothetical protein